VSAGQEDTARHEIVIIRSRGGGEDAAHHGGVWKIAYADFMTAMMAFFLVMWLINATDEKTLTQVATYFNPIRLADRATSPKGLHSMDATSKEHDDPKQKSNENKQSSQTSTKSEQGKSQHSEDVLFSDPYGVLTKIAAQADQGPVRSTVGSPKQGEATFATGEAYRDPFDPQYRQEVTTRGSIQVPTHGDSVNGNEFKAEPDGGDPATAQAPRVGDATDPRVGDATDPRVGDATDPKVGDATDPRAGDLADVDKVVPAVDPKLAAKTPGTATYDGPSDKEKFEALKAKLEADEKRVGDKAAAELEQQIAKAIDTTTLKAIPGIDVRFEADGVLITLTDQFDFGMFAISSAEPRPETIVVMDKIAEVLKARGERIIVRGHTDGRPFKSKTYDNWRLSTARAHMAYHMLVHGGLDAKRVERVEGYADRQLKVPSDSGAAPNRRIEILLRAATP